MTNLKIPPPYPKSHNILSGKMFQGFTTGLMNKDASIALKNGALLNVDLLRSYILLIVCRNFFVLQLNWE